ncbi:MAG: DUF1361 domain-containing protein [Flavobacterium sp.]|uniref:DUF1361 domain-containing protein n=1 Tax=Flavobacterium sp. TaxID=239 RepID=UPI0012208387|nr:DUF1361 domain-containing protein [Flavobacterium sp.]RZJ63225.1 MAG: DUF1361 domain-containing protein [Flavobacterium sp.]
MTSQSKFISNKQLSLLAFVGFNIALMAFRMLVTGTIGYGFLLWNLILSAVPWLVSSWLWTSYKSWFGFTLLSIIWLLFLPNAPYILTDFLHFRNLKSSMPAWFDLLLLASYSINGMLFALVSMAQMQRSFKIRFGEKASVALIAASAMLSGFGIFLGRYERYNSWDILSNPFGLVADSLILLTKLHTIGFTIGYGLLLLLVYFFFRTNSKTL